ncbi:hypothetical protein BpHYR1_018750 [Brachionus plicatilis]|uniref:Uncharacterized protein n=1 Tax=Brachionus plicatilis TaxID=10195 RepID=A0A3M7QNW9_BRAPC|nr:hypothetical protein BpHYR1_018750 [Brachionus plicatilis]
MFLKLKMSKPNLNKNLATYALVVRFDSNKDMESTALAKSFKDLDQNTESKVTLLNALLKNSYLTKNYFFSLAHQRNLRNYSI